MGTYAPAAIPAAPVPAAPVAAPAPAPTPATTASASGGLQLGGVPNDGWTIQIGAMPSEQAAVDMLMRARSTLGDLSQRTPYTQSVQANGTTLWRARFGGFNDRGIAQAACTALERQSFACLAVRPDR